MSFNEFSKFFSMLDIGLDRQWQADLKKPIRAHLAVLEKKLDAIKENLNEELRVVVGTVQVREAQLIKEQARVMARQTPWTVAYHRTRSGVLANDPRHWHLRH